MKTSRLLTIIFIIAGLMISSCSRNKPDVPTEPNIEDSLTETNELAYEDNALLAVYDVMIDKDARTFNIYQSERGTEYYMNLGAAYPSVLEITDYGFDPMFADIKINHPFPGSGVDFFDPRVIALVPANTGVSFNYPLTGVTGNNKVVESPDGYTKLFDFVDSSIPGNVNPFKAYFKNEPYRRWSSTETTNETIKWKLNQSGFGGSMVFKLVVCVSTSLPKSGDPIRDNAKEPVKITAATSNNLSAYYFNYVKLDVQVLDWQGILSNEDLEVCAEIPQVTDIRSILYFESPASENYEYIFSSIIYNRLNTPPGTYKYLISASDPASGNAIYQEFNLTVSGIKPPQLVETPLLNMTPKKIVVGNYYIYIAAGYHGLIIYDRWSQRWVKKVDNFVDTSGKGAYINDIILTPDGEHAFLADKNNGLHVVDVSNPQTATCIGSLTECGPFNNLAFTLRSDGAPFVFATSENYVHVILAEPNNPTYTYIAYNMFSWINGIEVHNNYLYVVTEESMLNILDISDPLTVMYIYNMSLPGLPTKVRVNDNYAFILGESIGLQILDISDPTNTHVVKSLLSVDEETFDITFDNEYRYAYIVAEDGLHIIDIDPVEDAYEVVFRAITGGRPETIALENTTRLWIGSPSDELTIMTLTNHIYIGSTNDIFITVGDPKDIYAGYTGSYFGVFVADNEGGLKYIKNDQIGGSRVIYRCGENFEVSNIFQAKNPINSYYIISLDDYYYGYPVLVRGSVGYSNFYFSYARQLSAKALDIYATQSLYQTGLIAVGSKGIDVFNCNGFHKTFNIPMSYVEKVVGFGDYAYALDTSGSARVYVISVLGPYDVNVLTYFDLPNARSLKLDEESQSNPYLYAACGLDGIKIVDISDPTSPFLSKTVSSGEFISDLDYSCGYVYAVASTKGMYVYDVDPVESAYEKYFISLKGYSKKIDFYQGKAYVAASEYGVHVIDMW